MVHTFFPLFHFKKKEINGPHYTLLVVSTALWVLVGLQADQKGLATQGRTMIMMQAGDGRLMLKACEQRADRLIVNLCRLTMTISQCDLLCRIVGELYSHYCLYVKLAPGQPGIILGFSMN